MASGKPLSIVVASFYFAMSCALGAVAAIYAFIVAPGFPGFPLMFAATFAFAVADGVCCYGLWSRQHWARIMAIGVIVSSIIYGAVQNSLIPEPNWLMFVITSLVATLVLMILDNQESRRHFGLQEPEPRVGIDIPVKFDFRARPMERNAE